jgi:hypothetical protein
MPRQTLADTIRAKLAEGSLPTDEPVKTWAGYGSGQPCAACDAPILPAQVEYEPEMADGATFKMHLGCHGLWNAVRIRRVSAPRPPSP